MKDKLLKTLSVTTLLCFAAFVYVKRDIQQPIAFPEPLLIDHCIPEITSTREAINTAPDDFVQSVKKDSARSGMWASVQKLHLRREPFCAWCGGTTNLQVHHIKPFALNPELHGSRAPGGELDDGIDGSGKDGNLITLCMIPAKIAKSPEWADHHERYGHNGHFHGGENLNVRVECAKHQMEMMAADNWPMK